MRDYATKEIWMSQVTKVIIIFLLTCPTTAGLIPPASRDAFFYIKANAAVSRKIPGFPSAREYVPRRF